MPTTLVVTATSWTTTVVRRVHFRSDDLSAFAGSRFTDRYVKLVFPRPGVVLPEGVDVRAMRGVVPPEDMPIVRTYTALYPDAEAGTLAIPSSSTATKGSPGPGRRAPNPATPWS